MMQSTAGFDIGKVKAVGAHFSVERQKSITGQAQNFYSSDEMTGEQYVKRLIQQQEDRYQKRLPFERGQYHQCIPNPENPKQLITVQLVKKVLDGRDPTAHASNDVFAADQEASAPEHETT